MAERAPSGNGSTNRGASARGAWLRLAMLLVAGALAGGGAAGTATGQSMLEPASRSAERVTDLWWLMFWLGTVVFLLVMLLFLFAVT